jgi:hypothetical protein
LSYEYFGVPFANFWAWFWVVTSFSFGYRLLARREGWAGRWLPPLLALVVGLAGVLGTNALIVFGVPPDLRNPLIAFVLLGALLILAGRGLRFSRAAQDPLISWIPMVLHLYFLLAGVVSGVIFNPALLLVISLALLAISLWLHRAALRPNSARANAPGLSDEPEG